MADILHRQSRAERQNTFDWLHILPVTVTISQYKSCSANISHILPVQVIFSQQELSSAIMICRNYLQFNRQFWSALPFCSALPIQYTPNGRAVQRLKHGGARCTQ